MTEETEGQIQFWICPFCAINKKAGKDKKVTEQLSD